MIGCVARELGRRLDCSSMRDCLGVRTPILYDIDLLHHRLILERLPGPTLKELLEDPSLASAALDTAIRAFGKTLGVLHFGGNCLMGI